MKKIFLTAILLCTMAATAAAQQKLYIPTLASDGLKGPVYVVQTVRWYTYGNQDVYPYTQTDVYGRDGLMMYSTYVSEWGMTETVQYIKNEQGRLVEIIHDDNEYGPHYIYSDDGRLLYVCKGYYDSIARNDTLLWITAYDEQGRTQEISDKDKPLYRYSYYPDGSLLSAERIGCWTIYYNRQGQVDSVSGNHRILYNKYGDEEERIYYHHGTERYNYGSERDQYDNWLSVDFVRDSIKYHVRRQIIYYDNQAEQKCAIWPKIASISIAILLLCVIAIICIKRKNKTTKQLIL